MLSRDAHGRWRHRLRRAVDKMNGAQGAPSVRTPRLPATAPAGQSDDILTRPMLMENEHTLKDKKNVAYLWRAATTTPASSGRPASR